MNRRHAFVLTTMSVLVACAIGAACTFPDVTFAPAGGTEAGSGEAGGDGAAGTDSSSSDASIDTTPIDASAKGDADTKVDAAGCTSCDCDGDGFFRRGAGCDGGPGAVYDCDDTDTFIKPPRDWVDDFSWPSTEYSTVYDWNCSGTVERAYPINFKCGGIVLTGCTGGQGFEGAGPNCGTGADYFECKPVNGFCTKVKVDSRHQLCK